ncbi:MAG TPA: alpha/beta hydrolase [Jatrophihabitans sp.]|nr:alpha/beta hydrolase [Jatrophihabitans sp.]
MRVGRVPAIVGGAAGLAGLAGAAAVAGIVQQRKRIASDRALINPLSAAALSGGRTDRQNRVTADDGVSLFTEQVGPLDAPLTVLFVHGYALNLTSFILQRKAILDRFGDRVRLVFFDLRSHGRSDHAGADSSTIEQLGADLYQVIESVIPSGPIVLVGHSMGGMTVMALAAAHPELFGAAGRVRAVALVNTSSGELRTVTLGLPAAFARVTGPVLPRVVRRAGRNAALVERGRALGKDLAWLLTKRLSFADSDVPPAVVAFATNMIAATPVDVVADFFPTLMAHDGREGLSRLADTRVLIIGSDKDALTPLDHSRRLAEALPNAQLEVATNSGHLLMLEHPEVVNQALLELIEQVYPPVSVAPRRTRRPA